MRNYHVDDLIIGTSPARLPTLHRHIGTSGTARSLRLPMMARLKSQLEAHDKSSSQPRHRGNRTIEASHPAKHETAREQPRKESEKFIGNQVILRFSSVISEARMCSETTEKKIRR